MRLIGRYGHRGRHIVDRWVRITGKVGVVIETLSSRRKARERARELNRASNHLRVQRGMEQWQ